MVKRQSKSQPTWTDVKSKLAVLNRTGLLGLIQDLYAAHKDNQTFLHARFDLGENVLKPYKQTIERWLWPDVLRRQDTSVAKARQAWLRIDCRLIAGTTCSPGWIEYVKSAKRLAMASATTWISSLRSTGSVGADRTSALIPPSTIAFQAGLPKAHSVDRDRAADR
jgi:hypothetical protein